MESELEKYKQRVKQRIERLLPAIAKVSIGDFSEEIEVPDEEDEFTELAAGLRMMTEDLEYHLTEFKRAEEERARVETVMATLEAIVDMVLVLDFEGKVVHANRAWLQILGLEPKDVLGKDIVDMPGIKIQKPEFIEKLMASIGEATEKGRIGPMDLVVVTMDGREVPTAPLSSYAKAKEIAETLKAWIEEGDFLLTEPVQLLSSADSGVSFKALRERPVQPEVV